ncbi:Cationic amino acid transporter, C-terminal [Dillenia turbinata]|uniref:Cationic amino acid transporter, C-terminal n=1 Tax=Dillenia turbinata TaxID=194707 RepID=A0AAN8VMN9_9MAGN
MVSSREGGGNPLKKRTRLCGCTKDDFLPEESFKSWGNYVNALKDTKSRLKDRLLSRSNDSLELQEICGRSENQMKKTLNWWDLMWFGVGAIMGAGIFVLTGEAARNDAGPAVVLSYLISGIAALLSVMCYTEFSIELPVAGGSFAYLRVELGDFIAFIAAGNILLEYIVAGASVARSWTSYFATLCNKSPNSFRINVPALAEGYNYLDPIAVAMSIAICVGASLSTKGSSRFNLVMSVIHVVVTAFILVAGLMHANPANFSNFAPFGVQGILKASGMLFFAYVGFDGVATLAEEIKNPARDIPIGLIGSMVIIITCYCALSATLCLMQPFWNIDKDAPFTVAFQSLGMKWANYIVALGALKGMTTVLLANIIGQARYFTHIGRTHMAPPILAAINKKTGTPVNATIVMTFANSVVAFFTSLDILSDLLSISTLFIFTLVALALIVRRYYVSGETPSAERNKLIGFLFLIIASAIGSAIYWALSGRGWVVYLVILVIWFGATLGLKLMVKEAKQPKVWGAPLMPWLPSISILVNVFIMGSIDGASFVRFGVWTILLLLYYLFVGLHASYDAAQEIQKGAQETQAASIEAGTAPQGN